MLVKHRLARGLIACACLACACGASSAAAGACLDPGAWAVPDAQGFRATTPSDVLASAKNADFVLLGEAHDDPDHHLWQLQSLAMLLGERDRLAIGMEMFPRRAQPVLDRWVAGDLDEAAFLRDSDWNRVWRFDPQLYLPILRFARLNHIPVIALNVERQLVTEVAMRGLSAIDPARREGITDPAPASAQYRESLRSSFEQHGKQDESMFENFVQAQLVWDRAFAQALSDAASAHPGALVVGIIGSGHLRYGHGVPHQLHSLGQDKISVWLPIPAASNCAELVDIADVLFPVNDSERSTPPVLGVYLRDEDGATTIGKVMPGSVAAKAGLASGDRIVSAAGVQINSSDDVIALVRRQYPGTWLPIIIERDGKTVDLIAKFPPMQPGENE
ncbi:MAG: ChaN family lipoprotein [Burkholderiales bacterium]|jgi:uncharacterized iron-regulated protein